MELISKKLKFITIGSFSALLVSSLLFIGFSFIDKGNNENNNSHSIEIAFLNTTDENQSTNFETQDNSNYNAVNNSIKQTSETTTSNKDSKEEADISNRTIRYANIYDGEDVSMSSLNKVPNKVSNSNDNDISYKISDDGSILYIDTAGKYTNSFDSHNPAPWVDENQYKITTINICTESNNAISPYAVIGWFGCMTSARTGKVTLSELTTINGLDNLNMSNVEDASFLFIGSDRLNTPSVSDTWFDNIKNSKKLTNAESICSYAKKLNNTFLNKLANAIAPSATNTSWAFSDCLGLTSLDIGELSINSVQADRMFLRDEKLTSINARSLIADTGVSTVRAMFKKCIHLEKLNFASWSNWNWDSAPGVDSSELFLNCYDLNKDSSTCSYSYIKSIDPDHCDDNTYAKINIGSQVGYFTVQQDFKNVTLELAEDRDASTTGSLGCKVQVDDFPEGDTCTGAVAQGFVDTRNNTKEELNTTPTASSNNLEATDIIHRFKAKPANNCSVEKWEFSTDGGVTWQDLTFYMSQNNHRLDINSETKFKVTFTDKKPWLYVNDASLTDASMAFSKAQPAHYSTYCWDLSLTQTGTYDTATTLPWGSLYGTYSSTAGTFPFTKINIWSSMRNYRPGQIAWWFSQWKLLTNFQEDPGLQNINCTDVGAYKMSYADEAHKYGYGMYKTFYGLYKMSNIDVSLLANNSHTTANCTNFSNMFWGFANNVSSAQANSFTFKNSSTGVYMSTQSAVDMSKMFGAVRNTQHIDISSFDLSYVVNMSSIFDSERDSGNNLIDITLPPCTKGEESYGKNIVNFSRAFYGLTNLMYIGTAPEVSYYRTKQPFGMVSLYALNMIHLENATQAFSRCATAKYFYGCGQTDTETGATKYNALVGSKSATGCDLSQMFENSAFETTYFSNWDISSVNSFKRCFADCQNISNPIFGLGIPGSAVQMVKNGSKCNLTGMFTNNQKLTKIRVTSSNSNWTTYVYDEGNTGELRFVNNCQNILCSDGKHYSGYNDFRATYAKVDGNSGVLILA